MLNDYFNNFFNLGIISYPIDLKVELKEKDTSATLKQFKIYCQSNEVLLIKSDKIHIQNLFINSDESKGQTKHCDYLLLTPRKIYFIELKSTFKDGYKFTQELINQFNGTLCITEYIDSVLKAFYGKSPFFRNIEKRYTVFFKNLPINKTATSLKPKISLDARINKTPNDFKAIQIENDEIIAIENLE